MADSKHAIAARASRRQFVQASTLAGAGLIVGNSLSLARSAHAAGSDVLKIGLIGCGGRGTGAAAQALSIKPSVKLVAMGDAFADRLSESLKNIQKEMGKAGTADRVDVPSDRQFVGFDAYEKVLATDVDVVVLATPPGFRPIHLKAAIEAGKHVFAEKPVAIDAPGVRMALEAAKLAKEKNLALGIGLQRHHQADYLETIKRLQDGAIGDLIAMRAYWNGAGLWVNPKKPGQTEMEYQMRNWYYFNWLCGDHIVEQHIHNLDVINWVKGKTPIRAQGMGGREVRTGEEFGVIFDHHAVEFEYDDGSRMFSFCRHIPGCWDSVTEHAHGTKGSADISAGVIRVNGESPWKYRGNNVNPYQQEHDDLFASILAGTPLNEGENGANATMTAVLGRMATYSGKMVSWDDALASNVSYAPKEYAWNATPPVETVAVPGQTVVV